MDNPEELGKFSRDIAALVFGAGSILSDATRSMVENLRNLANQAQAAGSATEAFARVTQDSIGKYALLAFRLTSVNSSVYGATEAFTSITPVIDATKEAFVKMSKFGSAILTAMPLGPARAAAEKSMSMFSAGLDFATESLKFFLDGAQKVANSFIEISKTGASFGGSIEEFARTAHNANVPLMLFSKVTQANVENLSNLGGSMNNASSLVFGSSMKIFNTNNRMNNLLVAMYGNFEELSEGVADYFSLLSKTGVVVDQNIVDEKMKSGAVQEYLLRQKELSTILGKSSKALKEAEDKRRTELDYAARVSRLANKDAADNLKSGMEIITKIFGQEAGDVAKEYFATGGNLYSEAGRRFAAMAPDAFKSIQEVVGNIDTNRTEFEKGVGAFFKANAASFVANAKAGEELYSLNRAANNEYLRTMGAVNSSVLANASTMDKLEAAFRRATAARGPEEQPEPLELDTATLAYVRSLRQVVERQKTMDKSILDNMTQLDNITLKFLDLQDKMIAFQGEMFQTVRKIVGDIDVASGNLKAFADTLTTRLGNAVIEQLRQSGAFENPPPPTPPPPTSSPTRSPTPSPPDRPPGMPGTALPGEPYAEGGITRGPSLAGEAGPEAVIPLARGDVPLKIDWTPLVSALNSQVAVSMDIKSLLEDTKSIQENILDATY